MYWQILTHSLIADLWENGLSWQVESAKYIRLNFSSVSKAEIGNASGHSAKACMGHKGAESRSIDS
jgi:hypothetical protein